MVQLRHANKLSESEIFLNILSEWGNVFLDISGYFHLDVLDFLVITAVNGFQFAENLSELKMLRGDGNVLCIELRVSSGYFDSIFRRNYKNAFWRNNARNRFKNVTGVLCIIAAREHKMV